MTLDGLIVFAGIVLSSSLIAILIACWPSPRARPILCFKVREDAECTARCLRTCHLVAPRAAAAAKAT